MIRVLIVNENRLIGNLIASVLDDEEDIEVVGQSNSIEEVEDFIKDHDIDIALISLKMRDQGAIKLTNKLSESNQEMNVIIFGLNESESKVLPFVEAGATGYVRNKDSVQDLLSTVRMAHKDRVEISPDIAYALMERIAELSSLKGSLDTGIIEDAGLTSREIEILEYLGKKYTNKDIAEKLFIEVGTVKNHVHNILDKLNVSSRGEASKYLLFVNKKETQ